MHLLVTYSDRDTALVCNEYLALGVDHRETLIYTPGIAYHQLCIPRP